MDAVVRISSKEGLHGRPGALLVHLSQKNPQVKIFLERNGKKAKADSVLSLLALGIKKGERVRVIVEGKNPKKIFSEVQAILQGQRH